jgi:hypothetical protein
MTKTDDELDEFGKHTLEPLRHAPPLDPQVSSKIKVQYMQQAEAIKAAFPGSQAAARQRVTPRGGLVGFFHLHQFMKYLSAGMIALAVLLIFSSITVYAAQDSLPGQVLYPVKSWSENIQLDLASSPQVRLKLVLKFTNRRMEEISLLLANGDTVSTNTTDRLNQELDEALQLASQMNDSQILEALVSIKDHATNQGMTIEHLINKLPPQADPAITKLRERLTEQVQISSNGETDPTQFRLQVQERLMERQEIKKSKQDNHSSSDSNSGNATAMPKMDNENSGNNDTQATEAPSHGEPGNGQNQQQPGNSNHDQNGDHNPKP